MTYSNGLIPAHAGKTREFATDTNRDRAHPRSRGENDLIRVTGYLSSGSSPLTRGKHDDVTPGGLHLGLIPAHAGKTPSKPRAISQPGAHPRSRGENRVIFAAWRALSGSSPLTRGKLVARDSRALRGGLIPAHAGKTVGVHCSLLC